MTKEEIVIFHHDERGNVVMWSKMGELVRCKDCKHRHHDGYCEAWGDSFYHWEDFEEVPEDMFCGYGERREDERT